MSIIIFLVILAVLILVHEFGHFIVAKKSGIRVDEFGLGFPPKIFSKTVGETKYTINAIPFGGFVKIFGEDPHLENISEENKHRSFYYKPKWIQASVLVAGVTFNVIFAWLLLSLSFMLGIDAPQGYSNFGEIQNPRIVVTGTLGDSPAEKSGIKPGDTIVSVSDGKKVLSGEGLTPESIQNIINESSGNVSIVYKRVNTESTVSVETSSEIVPDKKAIGISMDSVGTLKLPIHLSFIEGARTTWYLLKTTTVGLLSFLYSVVTLQSDFSQVAGPVGIAGIVGDAQSMGFVYLLSIVSLISINLAIINLLPFPALDGGRLFFVAIEAITRKPINPSFVGWANLVGFGFLMILMLVITTFDVLKLF